MNKVILMGRLTRDPETIKTMMRITIQDSENKEKKFVYYVVIKTLN